MCNDDKFVELSRGFWFRGKKLEQLEAKNVSVFLVDDAYVVNSELINEQSRANSNYSKLKTTAYLTNFSPVPK